MNPHIENFCRVLAAKRGEKLEEEALERLIESLYRLFQNMFGRNMIALLPEDRRTAFTAQYDKGSRDVDPEVMTRLFEDQSIDSTAVMKKTMQEFADLYFRNRPGDGPTPWEE
jgi:hypothetical protein